jgi:hypothetical protein
VTSRLGTGKTITFFTVYCPDQRCVIFILDEDVESVQLGVGVSIVPGLAVQQELQPVLLTAPNRKKFIRGEAGGKDRPSQYKSLLPGHSPPAKLGRTPY